MKISIWNIYHRLSYPDMIPLVKDGSPTIESVRWIVSKDLNPDMVYIGNEAEFFAGINGNTIIVHRNDMILVHNADPKKFLMKFPLSWKCIKSGIPHWKNVPPNQTA